MDRKIKCLMDVYLSHSCNDLIISLLLLLLSRFSHVRLLATPWTAAYQAPPSMGFSRQENWSGVPLPSPQPVLRTIIIEISGLWDCKQLVSVRERRKGFM